MPSNTVQQPRSDLQSGKIPDDKFLISIWTRFRGLVTKVLILLFLIVLWQLYIWIFQPETILVPSPSDTIHSLSSSISSGTLTDAASSTLQELLISMAIAIVLSILLVSLSLTGKFASNVLSTLTSILNPLPSIAIVPLVILWVGITQTALIIVTVNSIIWPMTLTIVAGFRSVPNTILMVGQNLNLPFGRTVKDVYLPSSLPSVIAGIKTGWAFAWRTVIAVELIFGAAGSAAGLGTFINNGRTYLNTPDVFAGLITIAAIGILVEYLFSLLEKVTITRWGMSASA